MLPNNGVSGKVGPMIAALASEDDRWDPIREHLDGDGATVFAHAL
jgi:hypothetical protein